MGAAGERLAVLVAVRDFPEYLARDADELGHRDEPVHLLDVNDSAALVEGEYLALNGFVGVLQFFQFAPARLAQRAVDGQDGGVVGGLGPEDIGDYLVADGDARLVFGG